MEKQKSPLVTLDRDSSDFLKGIAILGVLLSHTGRIFTEFSIVLFLVLSGFGLELSFRKKGLHGFWGKKIRNVWLPYIPVAVVAVLVRHVTEPDRILCTLIGLDFGRLADGTMWYISYIFAWYAAFYLLAGLSERLQKSIPERWGFLLRLAGAVTAGFFFCFLYNRGVWHENSGADNYRYSFPIGMFLAELSAEPVDKCVKKICWGIVLLGCTAYAACVYPRPFHIPTNTALMLVPLALTQLISISGKVFLPFGFIGRYSFPIYLWEGLLLSSRGFFYGMTGSQLGADIGFMAASFLLAVAYWELVVQPGEKLLERECAPKGL